MKNGMSWARVWSLGWLVCAGCAEGTPMVEGDAATIGICGNGIREVNEECDDGELNGNAPNGCRPDCKLWSCGDGVVDEGEDCDDGELNGNVANACRQTCELARCGDGIVDDGEECDDGNEEAHDGCFECLIELEIEWGFSGKPAKYVVPPRVKRVAWDIYGAAGYGAGTTNTVHHGRGTRAGGELPVTPGEEFFVFVGGEGKLNEGGWNGGGGPTRVSAARPCAGGGGATDVRRGGVSLEHRITVAGGGGGTILATESLGGAGKYPEGRPAVGGASCSSCEEQATGGAQEWAGGFPGQLASDGDFGVGGMCPSEAPGGAGAGGGGWYGGGSGGGAWKAGGGGSSYYSGDFGMKYRASGGTNRIGDGVARLTVLELEEPPVEESQTEEERPVE